MVKFNTVIKVMDSYLIKCSNSEIREKLSQMSHEEKREKLLDILTTSEFRWYNRWWDSLQWQKEYVEEIKKDLEQSPTSEYYKELLERNEQQLIERENEGFDYEKYIFRKHEPKTYSSKGYTEGLDSESREVKAQEKVEYTETEELLFSSYMDIGYSSLNRKLWSDEEMSDGLKKSSASLSKAINKHKLTENTVLYNGGRRTDLKIGDKINFKGFTSTSYDIDVASDFQNGCLYKFLAPKGTPCFSMNGLFSDSGFQVEHECLLDKGLKGTIVGFDGYHRVSDMYWGWRDIPIVVVQL